MYDSVTCQPCINTLLQPVGEDFLHPVNVLRLEHGERSCWDTGASSTTCSTYLFWRQEGNHLAGFSRCTRCWHTKTRLVQRTVPDLVWQVQNRRLRLRYSPNVVLLHRLPQKPRPTKHVVRTVLVLGVPRLHFGRTISIGCPTRRTTVGDEVLADRRSDDLLNRSLEWLPEGTNVNAKLVKLLSGHGQRGSERESQVDHVVEPDAALHGCWHQNTLLIPNLAGPSDKSSQLVFVSCANLVELASVG